MGVEEMWKSVVLALLKLLREKKKLVGKGKV